MHLIRAVLVSMSLAAGSAVASLPDPIMLGVAIELGDMGAAKSWLDQGMDPNMEADRIGTGLMIAAWEGNIPMMTLFHDRGADVNRVNRHGEQALQLAAWRGRNEAVKWLIDHGAAVNRKGKAWSAMHYAVYAGQKDVTRLLMDRGGDVNARAPNDSTALMMSALTGQEELAEMLLKAGADPTLTNDHGDTAVTWAMRNGNFRIARLLTSPEAFARVARMPPESFGPSRQSTPAPSEITELLQQIRLAQARKQPTDELRRRLAEAIERFKQENPQQAGKSKKPGVRQRPALVITASRSGGGERAQVVGETPVILAPGAVAVRPAASYDDARLAEFRRLIEELNKAQEEGRPTAELRQAVRDAYEKLKRQPVPGPGQP